MLHSAEIRWFLAGPMPESLAAWFRGGASPAAEPERADEYLDLPGCDTVGVKLRGGRFEIKARTGAPQPWRRAPNLEGRTDRWVKWSVESAHLPAIVPDLRGAGAWTVVRKARMLRKWAVDATAVVEIPPDRWPDAGCNVELTAIRSGAAETPWHSLGFEAFGPPHALEAVLTRALDRFFASHGAPPGAALDAARSMSYPAWLAAPR